MAIGMVSVFPIGEGTSLSEYVAESIKAIKEMKDVNYEITGMGTIIEGEMDKIFEAIKLMHLAQIKAGAKRVYMVITIDDRRDKPSSAKEKVDSVKKKLL